MSAGLGSLIADLLGLPDEDRRIAVAVGIGAGIGSIFKAPIGGALLASEILYKRDFETEVIFPALIASAVGYLIFGSVFGFTPVFGYYPGEFNPSTLPLYLLLGVVDGLMAILYVKTFYSVNGFFRRMRISNYVKPLIGGLVAGFIGLVAPEVLGTSYGWSNLAEFNRVYAFTSLIPMPLLLLLILLPFLKILATSFSIGSGGSGGVFAPGIVIGSFVGYDMWLLFHYIAPNPAPFVIVSMLAFFGAASKAPVAVMFMVVEMTGGYNLLPAAMIAVAIAYLVSGDYTIFQAQVPTRRDSPAHLSEYERPLLMELRVGDCELSGEPVVNVNDDSERAVNLMLRFRYTAIPVVEGDRFVGLVRLYELGRGKVGNYVIRDSPYVTPNSTLYDALSIMGRLGINWVPVVQGGRFLGILTLESLNKTYTERLRELRG